MVLLDHAQGRSEEYGDYEEYEYEYEEENKKRKRRRKRQAPTAGIKVPPILGYCTCCI